MKRRRLHETAWRYELKNGKNLRAAINNEDAEQVVVELRKCYDELRDAGIIDDDDYERWVEEGLDLLDSEDEDFYDSVDWELDQFYDLCDNIRVWVNL